MIFGCTHTNPNGIDTTEKITSIVIPSKVVLDDKLIETPQVVVTEPQIILLVESFLKDHSDGWKTTWHTKIGPEEMLIIHLHNGESFSLGYASDILIMYKQNDYLWKQVNQAVIEEFRSLLKTIKNGSNQNIEPMLNTPVY